jgi:hypothetical protein
MNENQALIKPHREAIIEALHMQTAGVGAPAVQVLS